MMLDREASFRPFEALNESRRRRYTPVMDVSHLLEGLNPAQREAVTAPPGHYLVLAGAGSGKTRVLTHRIGWLLEVDRVSPWSVLSVTFTNKAAGEMRARTEALIANDVRGLTVGTFHGIAHRLLRRHWREARLPETFQILDSDDQQRLVKRTIQGLGLDEARFPPRQATWFINSAKDEGKRPDALDPGYNPVNSTLIDIYRAYEAACQRAGLVDFAELLLRAHELWLHNDCAARALPGTLSPPADRRVPGHQHAAVRVDPRARRHDRAGVRGRRRRSGDLWLARRARRERA